MFARAKSTRPASAPLPAVRRAGPQGPAATLCADFPVQFSSSPSRDFSQIPAGRRERPGIERPDLDALARRGVAGPAAALPYLDIIQPAFGNHDLSSIAAHSDAPARAACRAIGAIAYARGNHVAFAEAPSLFTSAHEAAHVVQQRGGLRLSAGVGQAGDTHERQADEVAARVSRGASAEALLGGVAPAVAGRPGPLIQRRTAEFTRSGDSAAEAERRDLGPPADAAPAAADPQPESPDESDQPSKIREVRVIPDDLNPQAAAGEQIIFNCWYADVPEAEYQLEFFTVGGHFDSATGPTSRGIAGLYSGNLNFYVPNPWDGKTKVAVRMNVRKIADKSVVRKATWNFSLKTVYPTKISQKDTTDEKPLGYLYTYDLGPPIPDKTKPFYYHQSILEKFGKEYLFNVKPEDIVEPYRKKHSLKTAADVSNHFLPQTPSNNGTFMVDENDRIYDRHDQHDDLSNLVSQLTAPKDIEVALPQTYEAKPGETLGSYTITRILKAGGEVWKLKKG